ncbi:MAG: insulinase family protein [Lactobacillus sp.]|jgi:predicted Zn-dependent peptidase|uniref:EF-P 5-aminopentanol modification-associated protein YfmF n=1 Tax=Lacticaseibacillus suilingensis TaxID=2799577 RepID=A0ABW4BE06_9LACO|nr:insulinase family protein [Lacticaseibacillus suilingensis]MCI1893607.1 insulinase family protein [Lactobacillus sp.]MCI1918327.1 insulinase family protein [Lactobacillus sp.]MCI1941239.1 insulinase family protein [Lactobacillus sp.]MCI1971783.1 insulinase family protein [Lactobacillus sp.]MCI2016223.1 insulinase family protein [Lactobacillus sp.]
MRTELTQGVYLNVVPTTQFKTTRVAIHFIAPADATTYAARTLLTSVLETSSAAYPTQSLLSAALEQLFGASFGIGVAKDGQMHRVTATLNLVSDQLAQAPLLASGFALLKEVLMHPLLADGEFDAQVFGREQQNLAAYLGSLDEDRQLQASMATQRLYFEGQPAQMTPSFGTITQLEAVTPASLMQTYQQMLAHDQIEIVVLGQVTEADVLPLASALGFAPRAVAPMKLTVDRPVGKFRTKTQTAHVNQAKLNLAYHVDADLYGRKYFANVVAADLFGGSPLSLLFTNVREKASLAYYASAAFDPFRNMMVVQSGIDGQNAKRVQALIAAQLQAVQTGAFADDLLDRIKEGLRNSRQAAYDSPRFLARQELLHALAVNHQPGFAAYAAAIDAVTKAEVQAAAQTWRLQAVYLLKEQEEG